MVKVPLVSLIPDIYICRIKLTYISFSCSVWIKLTYAEVIDVCRFKFDACRLSVVSLDDHCHMPFSGALNGKELTYVKKIEITVKLN